MHAGHVGDSLMAERHGPSIREPFVQTHPAGSSDTAALCRGHQLPVSQESSQQAHTGHPRDNKVAFRHLKDTKSTLTDRLGANRPD